jgi:thiol-disulfide isomerase/thioredoxin
VEFWATWCSPCKVSIPHLNEIHNKYKAKDLIVIGQDCWEKDESLVEPFVKKMGDKMSYRVALDNKEGSQRGRMAETWMQAAGQDGIPSAFLVDKQSQIAWIGHPMELEDSVIEAVLAGNYDLKKAAELAAEKAKNQQQIAELSRELSAANAAKDWDKVDAKLNEMEKLLPPAAKSSVDQYRFRILLGKGDTSGAAKVALKLSETYKDQAMMQNQLAWDLLTQPELGGPELRIASQIAAKANEASKGEDPAILDTYARALFMEGKTDRAIELQKKAIGLAEDEMKANLRKTLESYTEGKLPPAE